MIHVYYRTSDNNNKKIKPPFITNENCLNNFIRCFNPESMQIIADNVNSETLDSLKTHGIEILQTKLGNPGSFKYALDLAIQRNNDDIIYFVENDYVHTPNSKQIMYEAFNELNQINPDGSKINIDYVTLYDHPDKYSYHYNINYNKYVYFSHNDCRIHKDGGKNSSNKYSLVMYGKTSYWKTTPSTCMTFAAKVSTLKEDYEDIVSFLSKLNSDMHMFEKLTYDKNRMLISPIPGAASHGDLLSPNIDWKQYI